MKRAGARGWMAVAAITGAALWSSCGGLEHTNNRVGGVLRAAAPISAPFSGETVCAHQVVAFAPGVNALGVVAAARLITAEATPGPVHYAPGATVEIEGERLVVDGDRGAPYPWSGARRLDDAERAVALQDVDRRSGDVGSLMERWIRCDAPVAIRGEGVDGRFVTFDDRAERAARVRSKEWSVAKFGFVLFGIPVLWVVFLLLMARRYSRIRKERLGDLPPTDP